MSMLEIETIGSQLVADFLVGEPQNFADLTEEERERVLESAGREHNWFDLWLTEKVTALSIELDTLSTTKGFVERFLDTYDS